jgi:hypothetical protein
MRAVSVWVVGWKVEDERKRGLWKCGRSGDKNQNQGGAAVWFVFGKERVMAKRLSSGQ